MRLAEGIQLYVRSMGKIFPVRHVARDADEANAYCASHRDVAVIAECRQTGLVFIADVYADTNAARATFSAEG